MTSRFGRNIAIQRSRFGKRQLRRQHDNRLAMHGFLRALPESLLAESQEDGPCRRNLDYDHALEEEEAPREASPIAAAIPSTDGSPAIQRTYCSEGGQPAESPVSLHEVSEAEE